MLRAWIPIAIAVTGMCGLVYVTVQQQYRQSLNDPQIQMAEDGAARLAAGDVPASLVERGVPPVDISYSLAPWVAVYDNHGTPLESSAVFDGAPPKPPIGVFDAAQTGLPLIVGHHLTIDVPANENRVSWQPRAGVRSAIVVVWVPETKQFVVAGRNMREIEAREGNLTATVGLVWLITLAASLFVTWFSLRPGRV